MNNTVITTQSAEETQKIGEEFAHTLKPGDIVLLYGDLGFGKTTFVQGVARGLGIEKRIISPTFVIVRTYELKRKVQSSKFKATAQNAKLFYHIDLYRTETLDDLKGIGMEEILRDETSIKLIEWPEKLGSIIPKKRVEVHFAYINENERKISIEHVGYLC